MAVGERERGKLEADGEPARGRSRTGTLLTFDYDLLLAKVNKNLVLGGGKRFSGSLKWKEGTDGTSNICMIVGFRKRHIFPCI